MTLLRSFAVYSREVAAWLIRWSRWILCALVACLAMRAFAYEPVKPWTFLAYQTTHGLPDNSITGIAQTSDGYLWVATKAGLLRFNGKTFSALAPTNLPPLRSHAVRALFRDHRDQLWLAIQRSPLFCLKPDGLKQFSFSEGLPDRPLRMITEDGDGGVWAVYPNGLWRIQNGKVHKISPPSNPPGVADLTVATDRQGILWCANRNLLAAWKDGGWQSEIRFDDPITAISAGSGAGSNLWVGAGGRVFVCAKTNAPVELGRLPAQAAVKVLLAGRSGSLWVGTANQGLFYWAGKTFEMVPTSQSEITCLFEDQEANVWAGTEGGGLNLIRPRSTALVNQKSGLPFESIGSVTVDATGNLWATSQNGKLGMAREGRWRLIKIETNSSDPVVSCVAADNQGNVWVGTSDRGLWCHQDGIWRAWSKANGLASDTVRSLLATSNGDVWVATSFPNRLHRLRAGEVRAIESDTQLGPIRALAEGPDGTLWIGTSEGQVQRVAGFRLIAEPAIIQSRVLSVRCLLGTPDGTLWIGYAGDGLGIFKNGQYQRLSTAAGLYDDYISQILADDRGCLWLNGNRGLSRVSIAELNAVFAGQARNLKAPPYSNIDGLPALRPARDIFPSACRSRDGHLWFATHNGLVAVRPENIRDNPFPPPLQLERVVVDDQVVAIYQGGALLQTQSTANAVNRCGWNSPLQLPPDYRRLDIEFAALSFSFPESVQFRYRLEGFDKDWVEADSSHHAAYPRLPAGGYQFHVIACNNSGVWNEHGRQLRIVVSPFFWETWWFRIGVGLVLTALLAGSVLAVARRRYRQKLQRLEAKRALEQERARIAKDIHDDLGASLTRISLLSQPAHSRTKDAETSAAYLAKIHQTARELTHSLGEVVWAVNPEHDTYESLSNYLGLYAQKFMQAAGIRCRINMPMQMPPQPLSAEIRHNLFLAFKEALNNAAKHAEASEVRVELVLRDFGFELLVADNGKGFCRDATVIPLTGNEPFQTLPGNGLANMRIRLQEIGGDCDVQSESGRGTTIVFRVNLRARRGHP